MKKVELPREAVHAGSLILVNRAHPYREGLAEPELLPVGEPERGVLLERSFAALLRRLTDDLHAHGQIAPVSGLRTFAEQRKLYLGSLAENGADFTAQYVALPGCSEHQTGLAVDMALLGGAIDALRPDFPDDGICGAFRGRAARYGLILRYPEGKEHITGIAHEPWHFRYVGAPHAAIMQENGDTLEEYHVRLRRHVYGENPLRSSLGGLAVEIAYLTFDREPVAFEVEDDAVCTVSGDNFDGNTYATVQDGQDAALFSRADLVINGTGSLTVYANYNDGIASRDTLLIENGMIDVTAKTHAIKGRDYLWITGGTITVHAGEDGIKATNDEQAALGYLQIDGGMLSVTAGDDALSAITRILITGGETSVKSDNNGVKSDGAFEMTGGSLTLDCADKNFVAASQSISPDAHVVYTE